MGPPLGMYPPIKRVKEHQAVAREAYVAHKAKQETPGTIRSWGLALHP